MKLCRKCNSSNQDFDTFCCNCGSHLDSLNESSTYDIDTGMDFSSPNLNGTNQLMTVKTNGMAIASMVLGIVSIPLSCCCYTGVIPGILAIIFGIISTKDIKKSLGNQKGEGMALAGLILGAVGLLLVIASVIYAITIGGVTSNQFWKEFNNLMDDIPNNNMIGE